MIPYDICPEAKKRIYVSHDEVTRACGDYMQPYLCRFCLRWHRGHSKKQRREERQAALKRMAQEAETEGLYDRPEAKIEIED